MAGARATLTRRFLALGLGVALTGAFASVGSAPAMTNGSRVSPAPPWAALVLSNSSLIEEPKCSGALVGDGWVLTAAHCVTDGEKVLAPRNVRVLIGRDQRNAKDQGAAYGVARIVVMPGYRGPPVNDAALLQLQSFESDRWNALPIAFEQSVVYAEGGVTLFGYGNTGENRLGDEVGSGVLWKSPDGAFVQTADCTGAFVCMRPAASTRTMSGDSGGPWLRWISGAWQLVGVHSTRARQGNLVRAASPLAATPDGQSLVDWVRQTAALPVLAANTIVRNPKNEMSWLVGDDGYRRWIPTGGDFLCLQGKGSTVVNIPQIVVDAIPDRVGEPATCVPDVRTGVDPHGLSTDGVRPLHLGDPLQRAIDVTGKTPNPSTCGSRNRVSIDVDRLYLIFRDGIFTEYYTDDPRYSTVSGAHVGMTIDELRALIPYAKAIVGTYGNTIYTVSSEGNSIEFIPDERTGRIQKIIGGIDPVPPDC